VRDEVGPSIEVMQRVGEALALRLVVEYVRTPLKHDGAFDGKA
jgi:hypothetical protein